MCNVVTGSFYGTRFCVQIIWTIFLQVYFVCVLKFKRKNVRTNKCNWCIPELELMWLLITALIMLFLIANNEADSGALGLTECKERWTAEMYYLVYILFAYNLCLICIGKGKLNTLESGFSVRLCVCLSVCVITCTSCI